jgi:hypothetical protein
MAEEVVLVVAGTGRALQAADKQNSHAHRNQNGKAVSIGFKPLYQAIHRQSPKTADSRKFTAD